MPGRGTSNIEALSATAAEPRYMSGQPDSSDDLIAELAKLMATNAKGDSGPAPAPAPKLATTPEGKPVVRIPGMDMPPLAVLPMEGPRLGPTPPPPRPAAETRPAEVRPASPQPQPPAAAAARPAGPPVVRIPGMDQPLLQPLSAAPPPIARAEPGRPQGGPAQATPQVPQRPAAETPQPPRPEARAPQPPTQQPRPQTGVAPGPVRFEPRIVGEARPPEPTLRPMPGVPAPAPKPQSAAPAAQPPKDEQRPHADGQGKPQGHAELPEPPRARDPIADLIAAEAGEPAAEAKPALRPEQKTPPAQPPQPSRLTPRPVPVAAVAPKPSVVTPRPAGAGGSQLAQRSSAPIPLKPGFGTRPVSPESDTFFVAPVFGGGKSEASPARPSAAAASAARSNDPMDEIESLIGEAVRVEMGAERLAVQAGPQLRTEPKVDMRPEPARPSRPAPSPAQPQPRRAGIKQHEQEAVPQTAEAAILAAAAATGAEVGRVDNAAAGEPVAARKFKPARARGMSGGMRQYVGAAVAGTLLLAAGLGLYWVLGMGRADPATAPVLTADATPVKEVPPAAAPATEMRSPVLDQIDGVSTPPDQEALATEDASEDADVVNTAAVAPADTSESGLANRKVRTVTVRPDGTIVTSEDAVAGAEALPVERPNVPDVPGADVEPSDLLNAVTAPTTANALASNPSAPDPIAAAIAGSDGAPPSNDVAAVDPATTAATPAALPAGATPTPAGTLAPTPLPRPGNRASMNGQPSRSVTAEVQPSAASGGTAVTNDGQAIDLLANAPAAAAPRTASTGTAAAYVQLSSQRSEGDARASLQNVSSRFKSLFQGNTLEVRRADLGAKGVYYRVMLPASSRSEANQICGQIKASGGDCFVP